ncbi:MAG: DGQHR domain-containing protein [Gammaproteobacteria bacterium]|nr:DGQHR domain-containing protein [Gammaproteobacteria bacterium]
MSSIVSAAKGKFGSTPFYVFSMQAKAFMEKTHMPSEMEDWEHMSLEEREQRDINYARIKRQIVPYLAMDPDRFFGAIIVAAKNFDPENFESVLTMCKNDMPKPYRAEAKNIGFLTFTGAELLIPLDGQHRVKAIKFAIEGLDEKGKPIPDMSPSLDIANEDVAVILIDYKPAKARKIFTKVNRYAKATTTGQNLVTDDDDIIAVLAREIANDVNLIGADLVKYQNNTLGDKDGYFTTLAALADCNDAIITTNFGGGKIDRTRLPDTEKSELYRSKVHETWKFLLDNIELFSDALSDKDESGNEKRCEIREGYLLGKPVPQVCLVKAFVKLTNLETNKFSPQQAAKKLNAIPWNKDELLWDGLFLKGEKKTILTKNAKLVTDIICYMCGEKLSDEEKKALLDRYRDALPEGAKPKQLPKVLP